MSTLNVEVQTLLPDSLWIPWPPHYPGPNVHCAVAADTLRVKCHVFFNAHLLINVARHSVIITYLRVYLCLLVDSVLFCGITDIACVVIIRCHLRCVSGTVHDRTNSHFSLVQTTIVDYKIK